MVHKLRARDVCHTSPRPNEVQGGIVNAAHSTPKAKQMEQPMDNNNEICTTALDDFTNIEPVLPTMAMDDIPNDDDDNPNDDDDDDDDSNDDDDDSTDVNSNQTKYEQKLHELVDECIFEQTFKKRRGISMYAVKKLLAEDYGYKPSRFTKPVSRYIAVSISSGKLQQITGHGAAGTFRLNRKIHQKHCAKLRKVSSQSHTLKKRVTTKSKHNTVD